jgi:hypothetical protein
VPVFVGAEIQQLAVFKIIGEYSHIVFVIEVAGIWLM